MHPPKKTAEEYADRENQLRRNIQNSKWGAFLSFRNPPLIWMGLFFDCAIRNPQSAFHLFIGCTT